MRMSVYVCAVNEMKYEGRIVRKKGKGEEGE